MADMTQDIETLHSLMNRLWVGQGDMSLSIIEENAKRIFKRYDNHPIITEYRDEFEVFRELSYGV